MKPKLLLFLLLFLVVTSALFAGVSAAAPGDYGLDWWTVDSGGGASAGAIYSLDGSIGQPEGGSSTGGVYALSGGFWGGGVTKSADPLLKIFPLFLH